MPLPRPALLIASCSALIFFTGAALAQSSQYSSAEVAAGSRVQLRYHASAQKDCTPLPLPEIRVLESPKYGTLIARRAKLKTNRISNCPNLELPVQVVFYEARRGYIGRDKVVYEVMTAGGEPATFTITITVKENQNPIKPKGGTDI